MSRRTKIHGCMDYAPWARLIVDGEMLQAEMRPEIFPDGELPGPGRFFTLHFRGNKFLYAYVPQGPPLTRHQLKKARIEARHLHKVLFGDQVPA